MKVSFPHVGDYYVPIKFFLENVLNEEVIIPPKMTKQTILLGSKYSPDFVCTPFKHTLGSLIESGADTFIQLGGGCRYGYYAEVQEKILKDINQNIKIINLVTDGDATVFKIYKKLKKNFKINIFKYFYYGFITLKMVKFMDIFDEYIRQNVAFEIKENEMEELKELMLTSFSKTKNYKDLLKKYRYFKKEFQKVKIRKPDNCLKVGIIGELYTIMEPSANYFLEKELAKANIEITRFTNATYLLLNKNKFVKKFKKSAGIKYIMGADATDNIIRTKYLCEEGYDGIIHVKASFCTPEIAAMPIINKVAQSYKVPVLFFTFDTNTSETGIRTRLEAFFDMIEMRRKK